MSSLSCMEKFILTVHLLARHAASYFIVPTIQTSVVYRDYLSTSSNVFSWCHIIWRFFFFRFQHIKKNIRDIKEKESVQRLVQSSSDKLSAFIGKFKKPKTPKRDYKDSASLESLSEIHDSVPSGLNSQISHNSAANDSDISDCNLQTNAESSSDLQKFTKNSANNSRFFIPRVENKSSEMLRLKTQSAAVTLDPPPLPPRNAKSQYL